MEPPAMHMREFYELMTRTQNAARAQKGLPPVEVPPPGPPPPAPAPVIPEPPVPAEPIAALTPESADWYRVQDCLHDTLALVVPWAYDWEPKGHRTLFLVAGQCETAAHDSHPEEYTRLKAEYLRIAGKLIQLYWKRHFTETHLDFVALALGGKPCRLENNTAAAPVPGRLTIHTCEIPQLLCMPPRELKKLCDTLEVFPGARLTHEEPFDKLPIKPPQK